MLSTEPLSASRVRVPVEIHFKTAKLQKTCNAAAALRKAYGGENASRVQRRLAVLEAAPSLADVPNVPPERCHLLTGDRAGCFAVDIKHPFRIVFAPTTQPPPRKADGGIDLRKVTSVTILEIVDYH